MVVDSDLLTQGRSEAQLALDRSWLLQNNLSVAVDMSRVLNVYPLPPGSYRMFKYMPAEYNKSMAYFLSVVERMPLIGATDLLLTLHRASKTTPDAP
eukprot:SAG11_NODE_14862_length_597_cov_1.050201_1_plen_96_part_10